ncbi:MAG TPA: hypothetical protein VFA48_07090 [Gammaproteobacteria bacterium]|nr:hypothetical protein [Gammaproteobacteria bacterium]
MDRENVSAIKLGRLDFYAETICGQTYYAAVATTSPIVKAGPHGEHGTVHLHSASIARSADGRAAVLRYRNEMGLDLGLMPEDNLQRFSRHFGIPFSAFGEYGYEGDHGQLFRASPAFPALLEWVGAHPRLAKRFDMPKDEPYRWCARTSMPQK